eukprot:TRINITY_DN66806_c6_g1_i1.p1 TRINITY_DN66806_c6_g1~~TRINITY_DN66806_c6_g1_i1.p1  ORF type:complete len:703 (-),score=55.58 TRINITY_DN66806_c6_g1_i1:752-2779(-)
MPRVPDTPVRPDLAAQLNYVNSSFAGGITTVYYEIDAACNKPFGASCVACICGTGPGAQGRCNAERYCEWQDGHCQKLCMFDIHSWVIGACNGNPDKIRAFPNTNSDGFGYLDSCGVYGLAWRDQLVMGGTKAYFNVDIPGEWRFGLVPYGVSTGRKCYVGVVSAPVHLRETPAPPPPPEPANDCPVQEPTLPVEDISMSGGIQVEVYTPRIIAPQPNGGVVTYRIRTPPNGPALSKFTLNTCDGDPTEIWSAPPIEPGEPQANACGMFGKTWAYPQLPGTDIYYSIGTKGEGFTFEVRNYTIQTNDKCFIGEIPTPISYAKAQCDSENFLECAELQDEEAAKACCNDMRDRGCGWEVQNSCIKRVIAERTSFIRFIHGSWNAKPVDLYINSEQVLSSVFFGAITPYKPVVPSTINDRPLQVQVTRVGNPNLVLATTTLTTEAKKRHTVVLVGTLNTTDSSGLSLEVSTDDAGDRRRGLAKVPLIRIINFARLSCISVWNADTNVIIIARVDKDRIDGYKELLSKGNVRLAIRRCASLPPPEDNSALLSTKNALLGVNAQRAQMQAVVGADEDLTTVELDALDGNAFTITVEGDENDPTLPFSSTVAKDYYAETTETPPPGPSPGDNNGNEKLWDKYWFWAICGGTLVVIVLGLATFAFLWNRRRAGYASIDSKV